MAAKSLVKAENGYGITGVTVFFSVPDIYRMKEIIANLEKGDESAKQMSITVLSNLLAKLGNALDNSLPSVFDRDLPSEE